MEDNTNKNVADQEIENTAGSEDMDPEEAAIVARVLAKMMVAAEKQPVVEKLHAKELPEEETAERAADHKISSSAKNKRKSALPAIIAEAFVLILLLLVLGKYFHIAPDTPTIFSDPKKADSIRCQDGLLIVNSVSARVPEGSNVSYNISYSWSEDDKDYPTVPHAIVASYMDSSGENALYDISLYKESFTEKKNIPSGLNQNNWFDDWATEENEDVHQFPYKVGQVNGFCISTMDSASAVAGYRNYTYYFAVQENDGISVYVLEGTCYDISRKDTFTEIVKNSIDTIEIGQTDI